MILSTDLRRNPQDEDEDQVEEEGDEMEEDEKDKDEQGVQDWQGHQDQEDIQSSKYCNIIKCILPLVRISADQIFQTLCLVDTKWCSICQYY